MSNKYNSYSETFLSNPTLNVLLSSKATPPADLVIANGDFTAMPLYTRGMGGANDSYGKWEINDIPRLIGYGIFCNIADGLVQNDDAAGEGISLSIAWDSYTSGNVQTQVDFTGSGALGPTLATTFYVRVPHFNYVYPCDFRWNFSALNTSLDHFRGRVLMGAANGATFSMISVNPDFAAKRLIMYPTFIFEHSRPIRQSQAF